MTSRPKKKQERNTTTKPKKAESSVLPINSNLGDSLDSVPEEVHSLRVSETTICHQGPLPPPGLLREYESIIPNAGERLLCLVENEQQHRHKSETDLNNAIIDDLAMSRKIEKRGQLIALLIFVICEGLGVFLFTKGSVLLASILMGAPMITAASKFLKKDPVVENDKEYPLPPTKQE